MRPPPVRSSGDRSDTRSGHFGLRRQGAHPHHLRPGRIRLHRAAGRASGFLLKDTPPAGLLAAIRVIAAGDAQLAPAITRRLIAEFARRAEPGRQPAATLEGVTDREREVLTLIARGLSNAEIAQALHVTMATAKTHVGRLLAVEEVGPVLLARSVVAE
jgi:DNA-binding CsgD family transcriptional regulator